MNINYKINSKINLARLFIFKFNEFIKYFMLDKIHNKLKTI